METAFSNVACRASSVAVKDRLFTTRVLLAAPATSGTEGQEISEMNSKKTLTLCITMKLLL